MKQGILVINAGSSSVKVKIFDFNLQALIQAQISGLKTEKIKISIKSCIQDKILNEFYTTGKTMEELFVNFINSILSFLPEVKISLIGHRVVHGGINYNKPTLVNETVINDLKAIIPLAPLHLPYNTAPMEILKNIMPEVKQIACFDTGFHSENPEYIRYYAIPRKLIEEDKIMRYGFHGLSCEYIMKQLNIVAPELYNSKVIICHLGAGASVTAVKNGKGLATSMGFTALDGVMMGTRCGNIDASILLYLIKYKNYTYEKLEKMLYSESGILGISEESSDFYTIENSSKTSSKEAYKMFIHSIVKKIGELIAILEGIDCIIFTGGVGENSQKTRFEVIKSFAFLGAEINEKQNSNNEIIISSLASKIKIMAIKTNEELTIAMHAINY